MKSIKIVELPEALGSYGAKLISYLINGKDTYIIESLYRDCADIIGISVHFPRQIIYLKKMFEYLNISMFRVNRKESDPLIIFGGYGVNNPEPIVDFADLVCIGDGERFAQIVKNSLENDATKKELINKSKELQEILIPKTEYTKQWHREYLPDYKIIPYQTEELKNTPPPP